MEKNSRTRGYGVIGVVKRWLNRDGINQWPMGEEYFRGEKSRNKCPERERASSVTGQ